MNETEKGAGKSGIDGGTVAVLLGAAVFLAMGGWVFWNGWTLTDAQMSIHGWIALTLGVVCSLGLGIGLMMLMYHSHKSGHDEAADEVQKDIDLH